MQAGHCKQATDVSLCESCLENAEQGSLREMPMSGILSHLAFLFVNLVT